MFGGVQSSPARPQRILVLGSCGAGKSTFARALGDALGLPVVHLDREFFAPGWVEPADEVWAQRVGALIARPQWIVDGNYSNTLAQRLERAQAVIYLDLPGWLCTWRVVRRGVRWHGRTRPDLAAGCPERLDPEFVRYTFRFNADIRPKTFKLLSGARLPVTYLRSRRAIAAYLNEARQATATARAGA